MHTLNEASPRPWWKYLAFTAIAVLLFAASAGAQTTALTTISQAGDYAGGGVNRSFTPGNASFSINTTYYNGITVSVQPAGTTYPTYRLTFRPPIGETLQVGTYPYAIDFAYRFAATLEVDAPSYCSSSSGRYVVRELVTAPGGTIVRFAADFEQHCNDGAPALFGAIRFQSTINTADPFDGAYPVLRLDMTASHGTVTGGGMNCGSGGSVCSILPGTATQVALTATADPGYMFAGWSGACSGGATMTVHVNMPKQCAASFYPLAPTVPQTLFTVDSVAGNWVGKGRVLALSAGSYWQISTSSWNNAIGIEINALDRTEESYWRFDFAPVTGGVLGPGYYPNGRRFATTTNPEIDIASDGAGCNQSFGSFTVHELRRNSDGSIASLAIDFEHHCEQIQVPTPIVGSLRYNSAIPPTTFLSVSTIGSGTVTSTPAGMSCGLGGTVCNVPVTVGRVVTLIPQAAPGWQFSGWTGTAGCSSNPMTITARMLCQATFVLGCPPGISPSTIPIPAAGTSVTVNVAAAAGCSWQVTSSNPWLTVIGGSGTGSGSFTLVASAKRSLGARSGTLSITGGIGNATVTQAGGFLLPFDAIKWNIDRDARTDVAVWRPGNGVWYSLRSSSGTSSGIQWGAGSLNDVPVPGDYDGDLQSDPAVWRPGSGTWYVLMSTSGYASMFGVQLGSGAANDVPVAGDYDGDGRTDPAIWRPSNGTWYVKTSSSNYTSGYTVVLGDNSLGDRPVAGDYDGDGRADIAVWRPGTGMWSVLLSHTEYDGNYVFSKQWGIDTLGDKPVTGDFDGDGLTDIGVWRSTSGMWYVLPSSANFSLSAAWGFQWGLGSLGDVPLVGDFDGDGKSDLVVWRAPSGTWFIRLSSTSFTMSSAVQWGAQSLNDVPLAK